MKSAQEHEQPDEASDAPAGGAEQAEGQERPTWGLLTWPRPSYVEDGTVDIVGMALRLSVPAATSKNGVPKIVESLSDLDAAARALEQVKRGSRQATLLFLACCMAVRRNADRNAKKRAILDKALAERGLRARSSDKSEFTRIVKYAERRCSLSSALRSIYVAALEHAYAHDVQAEDVPGFVKDRGGVKKCALAHRASRRGNGGAARDDVMARARKAAKDAPSVRVAAAVPPGETADMVVLLLARDQERPGHWKRVAHKPADERTVRALLPSGP